MIQSDNGTEFLNKTFQKLLKENKVWHIAVNVGDHNKRRIIERFNRTIEGLISKYQESRNTNWYIDVLDDLVYNYNHRSIGRTPQNMHNENPNEGSLRTDLKFTDIEIGDKVRILLGKSTFQKGYEASFSKEIYTVVSGNGYTFQIANNEGFIMKSRYKYFQLQKIEESLVFQNVVKKRPLPPKKLLNKREIDSLEKNILQPLNKKRRHEYL